MSTSRIDLTWSDTSRGESGFKIYRKIGDDTFIQIATTPRNVTTYSNTGLNSNQKYTYRVRSYFGSYNSSFSNQAMTSTGPNFYINGAASTNGAGTQSSPWNTVASINNFGGTTGFLPGDVIYFKRGTTVTGEVRPKGSGNSSAQITIDAYGTGNKPVIHGLGTDNSSAIRLQDQQYWTIQNIEVTNIAQTYALRYGISVWGKAGEVMNGIKIIGNTVRNVFASPLKDPVGLPSMYYCGGIYVEATYNGRRMNNVLIKDNEVTNIVGIGINVKGEVPPPPPDGEVDWANLSTNVAIRNNKVIGTGADGIICAGVDSLIIEQNYVNGAGTLGVGDTLGTLGTNAIAGIWVYVSKDNIIQNNVVLNTKRWHGDGQAFDCDWALKGKAIFQYNYSRDNEGGAFMSCASLKNGQQDEPNCKVIFRYNISQNDASIAPGVVAGKLIHFSNRNNAEIYNNTFYSNKTCPFVIINHASYGNIFKNNIFYGANLTHSGGCEFNYNIYYGGCENSTAYTSDPNRRSFSPFVGPAGGAGNGVTSARGYNLNPLYGDATFQGQVITNNGGRDIFGTKIYCNTPDIGAVERVGVSSFIYQPFNQDNAADLWIVKKWHTGTGKTELHVLNGSSYFTNYLFQDSTAEGQTLDYHDYHVANYNGDNKNDLFMIKKLYTGSGKVEVHVLNGANNFKTYLTHRATIFNQADYSYTTLLGDYNGDGHPDLFMIRMLHTGTNSTEVHILNGADNYQSYLLQTGTGYPESDYRHEFALADYNNDNVLDLYIIKKRNTTSGHTEVNVLSGANQFQSSILSTPTYLSETDDRHAFCVGKYDTDNYPDLIYIKKRITPNNVTEVHVLSGADNFQSEPVDWLLSAETCYPATN